MADIITTHHLRSLADFDLALAKGANYPKLALQGAAIGAIVSLFLGRPRDKRTMGHAVKYGAWGAGVAVAGVFALFQIGKLVSGKSHEAVADAASTKAMEHAGWGERGWGHRGWGGRHEGRGWGHHHHHHHDWDRGPELEEGEIFAGVQSGPAIVGVQSGPAIVGVQSGPAIVGYGGGWSSW